jgi:hypothetical protein
MVPKNTVLPNKNIKQTAKPSIPNSRPNTNYGSRPSTSNKLFNNNDQK